MEETRASVGDSGSTIVTRRRAASVMFYTLPSRVEILLTCFIFAALNFMSIISDQLYVFLSIRSGRRVACSRPVFSIRVVPENFDVAPSPRRAKLFAVAIFKVTH